MNLKYQQLNQHTGAFALLDSLVRHQVKHIFGYPGGAILPIYDELYSWEEKKLIQHILVRHEQAAAHAADAYARATGVSIRINEKIFHFFTYNICKRILFL